jgi:hypothetical protein
MNPRVEQTFLMLMRAQVDIPSYLDDEEPVRLYPWILVHEI